MGISGLVTVLVLTAGFNFLLRSNLHGDADRVLQARASAALGGVEAESGQVRVSETPDEAASDAGVWIYNGTSAIERPTAPAGLQLLADQMAANGGPSYSESNEDDIRLHAIPISSGGENAGTVVVALSVEPYERSAQRALVASLIFAVIMLCLIIVLTRMVVSRALGPVAAMTSEAAEWSEHDLDHRFNLGAPHDELTQLASTFDSMLARLAANLRHEQRLTAEVSHELRTPLAAITAEAELALQRPREGEDYRVALEGIQRRAVQLGEILETLLLAARTEALPDRETADVGEIADQAIETLKDGDPAVGEVRLENSAPGLRVHAGLATARQILAPVLENAVRYGGSGVEMAIAQRDEFVVFEVRDEGPGFAPGEHEQVFEPGTRGAAGLAGGGSGAGLGLALSRRLARAVGGDVIAESSDSGGRVLVRLPMMLAGQ